MESGCNFGKWLWYHFKINRGCIFIEGLARRDDMRRRLGLGTRFEVGGKHAGRREIVGFFCVAPLAAMRPTLIHPSFCAFKASILQRAIGQNIRETEGKIGEEGTNNSLKKTRRKFKEKLCKRSLK